MAPCLYFRRPCAGRKYIQRPLSSKRPLPKGPHGQTFGRGSCCEAAPSHPPTFPVSADVMVPPARVDKCPRPPLFPVSPGRCGCPRPRLLVRRGEGRFPCTAPRFPTPPRASPAPPCALPHPHASHSLCTFPCTAPHPPRRPALPLHRPAPSLTHTPPTPSAPSPAPPRASPAPPRASPAPPCAAPAPPLHRPALPLHRPAPPRLLSRPPYRRLPRDISPLFRQICQSRPTRVTFSSPFFTFSATISEIRPPKSQKAPAFFVCLCSLTKISAKTRRFFRASRFIFFFTFPVCMLYY